MAISALSNSFSTVQPSTGTTIDAKITQLQSQKVTVQKQILDTQNNSKLSTTDKEKSIIVLKQELQNIDGEIAALLAQRNNARIIKEKIKVDSPVQKDNEFAFKIGLGVDVDQKL